MSEFFNPSDLGVVTTPFQHQRDCHELSKDREYFAILSDLGTGKCLMTLMTAAHLYKSKKIQRVLIVVPRGCARVWPQEVEKHFDINLPYRVGFWSSQPSKEDKASLVKLEEAGECLRVLVVNIEAFVSDKALELAFNFVRKQSTLMVIDEATAIKNPSAKRTKICVNIGKFAAYRRILSGDLVPNGLCDAYMPMEFLKKNCLGFQNFYAFRNRFSIFKEIRFGNASFKKICGYRDTDYFKTLMRKFSFIVRKEDCLSLPPRLYTTRDIELNPRQREIYNSMLNESFVQLENCQVTAQLVLTQLVRLHQICAGFLMQEGMDPIPLEGKNDRIEALLSILEEAPGKVIIWAIYRQSIRSILAAVREKFGEDSIVDFYGETSEKNRQENKELFQDPDSKVRFIVSNAASGKFGNTWIAAKTAVYFQSDFNLESRRQSEARCHRVGQDGAVHDLDDSADYFDESGNKITPEKSPSVLYIDLIAPGTIEERMLKVVKAKKKLSDEVLASNWRWLLGQQIK